MGWTYYGATQYKNGKIDRLKECRDEFGKAPKWATIVKDALVGTTYYAAMKSTDTGEIWALIVLTSTENGDFRYKDMSEDMEPYYYDCPVSILNLLSPVANENALEWRRKCRVRHEQKRRRAAALKRLNAAKKITVTLPQNAFLQYPEGGTILLSRLIDGRWLDWEKRIAFPKKIILDCGFTVTDTD